MECRRSSPLSLWERAGVRAKSEAPLKPPRSNPLLVGEGANAGDASQRMEFLNEPATLRRAYITACPAALTGPLRTGAIGQAFPAPSVRQRHGPPARRSRPHLGLD